MALLADYTAGTISVSANGTAVTGTGTAWQTAGFRDGDWLIANGWVNVVASVNSNTSITLAQPWRGGALSGASYRLRYMSDGSRASAQARQLIDLLGGSGNLEAIAGLAGAANMLAYFTGAGTMATTPLTPAARGILALAGSSGAKLPVVTGASAAALRDIVGTVSQSGGVPTGAIIERGSNANGEYVRFADGTQICAVSTAVSTAVSLAGSGLFSSDTNLSLSHPASFAVGTAVTGGLSVLRPSGTPFNVWPVVETIGTGATIFRIVRSASDSTVRSYSVLTFTIGRWF